MNFILSVVVSMFLMIMFGFLFLRDKYDYSGWVYLSGDFYFIVGINIELFFLFNGIFFFRLC